MTTYQLPPEPDGPLWDEADSKWMRYKENMWYGGNQDMYLSWGDVVHYFGPLTATIANEKDEKMAEYSIPAEHEGVILWDKYNEPWVKSRIYDGKWVQGTAPYEVRNKPVTLPWVDLLCEFGPLTTTLPVKEGDTGLTAEQVWNLPEGTVIWPELAEAPEPWLRLGDYWESILIIAGNAGELQCYCGDSFRVLILGGGE